MLLTLAVFVLLALFGRSYVEVARLWLFMAPLVCIVAASEMQRRLHGKRDWMILLLFVAQIGTTWFVKRFQDFW